MSLDIVTSTPGPDAAKQQESHPFEPLSADEIRTAVKLISEQWPPGTDFQFKAVTLEEPPKAEVLPYLEAEHSGKPLPAIIRKAFVTYYLLRTNKFHEARVNLSQRVVERNVRLGANVHGNGDGEEILAIERAALEDQGVKAEIAKLQLPEGTVVISDPWIYGADGINDDDRMYQCFLYMRDPKNPSEADSNHYAFPLSISPVVTTENMKVIRIDHLPTGADNTIKETQPHQIRPPNEYVSDYQDLRHDLKPLHIVQPEGASFQITRQGWSSVIEWQKWYFRVGFNQREGTVLYDVRYDGRSLFYRLSLSDMSIPYADPRHPFHKKAAFDLGDAGAGAMANNLKLGCDCLGAIHYLDAVIPSDKGEPTNMENVICVHEQDGGISWKHTNYRTGRAAVVRQRELVVQSIITVSNYEYILAWIFNQAGEVTYEVRATGILSTQPIDDGVDVPFGTIVHPGVLATHHQHFFSLRIDPQLDGPYNSLTYTEAHPMPRSDLNPHGTGYATSNTLVTHSGGYDFDITTNRTFKIENPSSLNPINGKPVSYKIQATDFQKILADRDSYHYKRAEFADRNIYVVRYHDGPGELYAGGLYTNQSRGGTGVRSWASRNEPIENEDIVVFVQFGINHIPRVEDFPVMPCEILRVSLKPVGFFDRNPAIDVPPSMQGINKSVALRDSAEEHRQAGAGAEAVVKGDGEVVSSSKL